MPSHAPGETSKAQITDVVLANFDTAIILFILFLGDFILAQVMLDRLLNHSEISSARPRRDLVTGGRRDYF
jgi:hypothetical protein